MYIIGSLGPNAAAAWLKALFPGPGRSVKVEEPGDVALSPGTG